MSENFDNPYVDALERIQRQDQRIAKLEAAIDEALATASGRWSEWGGRAMSVAEILEQAKGRDAVSDIPLEMNPRGCNCICHQVGLFGLMCCQCSRDAIVRALDELANGKASIPVAPIEGEDKDG